MDYSNVNHLDGSHSQNGGRSNHAPLSTFTSWRHDVDLRKFKQNHVTGILPVKSANPWTNLIGIVCVEIRHDIRRVHRVKVHIVVVVVVVVDLKSSTVTSKVLRLYLPFTYIVVDVNHKGEYACNTR